MKKCFLLTLLGTIHTCLFAQTTDSLKLRIEVDGYLETYYSYDLSNPAQHRRPDFLYSYNRHNEVNLNMGYMRARVEKDRVKAKLALMAGTYPEANLAAEPLLLRSVYEASAAVKLSAKKELWFEAGIFASHIGFESAEGLKCGTLTRSLAAENSPYYESGTRLNYETTDRRWLFSVLYLNGWQHIRRPNGNNTPAFGHQVQYKPNEHWLFNSSSFIGSDTPDTLRKMRYFHDFYMSWKGKRVELTAGFDIGAQQAQPGSSDYDVWYTPVLIAYLRPTAKTGIGIRGEYYIDPQQVIVQTYSANGFNTAGYSVNFDYYLRENVCWRIEGRGFYSDDPIFILNGDLSRQNYAFTTSLAVKF